MLVKYSKILKINNSNLNNTAKRPILNIFTINLVLPEFDNPLYPLFNTQLESDSLLNMCT
jgi:hypothetical protein